MKTENEEIIYILANKSKEDGNVMELQNLQSNNTQFENSTEIDEIQNNEPEMLAIPVDPNSFTLATYNQTESNAPTMLLHSQSDPQQTDSEQMQMLKYEAVLSSQDVQTAVLSTQDVQTAFLPSNEVQTTENCSRDITEGLISANNSGNTLKITVNENQISLVLPDGEDPAMYVQNHLRKNM